MRRFNILFSSILLLFLPTIVSGLCQIYCYAHRCLFYFSRNLWTHFNKNWSLTDKRSYMWVEAVSALTMGMENVVADRISFGGVKELQEIYTTLLHGSGRWRCRLGRRRRTAPSLMPGSPPCRS